MNNKFLILALLSATLIQSATLFCQSRSKFSITLEPGITYGDANYGNEFALDYLRNEDYNGLGASNDAGFGFDFDIGLLYNLNQRIEINISVGYLSLGTQVLGNLNDLKSTVTRPLSSTIPIRVEGRINYSLLNFGGDFIYNLNGNNVNGFNISVGMNYLLFLNADWKVDVNYETGNTDVQSNLSDVANTDLNNVLATNLKLGYNIILSDKYRITPSFGFTLGLNEFSDEDSLNPNFFSLGVRFNALR